MLDFGPLLSAPAKMRGLLWVLSDHVSAARVRRTVADASGTLFVVMSSRVGEPAGD
jgi:hypothetical protein